MTDDARSAGLARSPLTRALSRLGAVAVALLGLGAAGYAAFGYAVRGPGIALLVGAFLLALVLGGVLYGARAAGVTRTPYWRS